MGNDLVPVPDTGKPKHAPNLVRLCMDAVGRDFAAALLLMRILFWAPFATIVRGGYTWIAKSAREWCEEAALTIDQYKRAIRRLRKLGLVVTEQHKFAGKNVTYTRLTEGGRKLLPAKQSKATQPKKGIDATPEKGGSAPLNTQGETNKEKQQGEEKKSGVLPHADSPPSFSQGTGTENSKIKPGDPMESKNADSAKETLQKVHKPKEHPSLKEVWKGTVAEVEGGFIPALTVKQKGQLKHFAAKCPEGKAAQVLEFCLCKWSLFTSQAKSDAGLFKAPASPDIGFLLKHVGTAVNLYLEEASKPKFAPPAAPIVPKKPLTGPEDEKPGSAEEVLKILKG